MHPTKRAMVTLLLVLTTSLSAEPAGAASDPVLVGAGDIASCSGSGDEATAALLDDTPGTVITLGDNTYGDRLDKCYDRSWGRHRDRTKSALGNHDYRRRSGASDYFRYFGDAGGEWGKGYYSYDRGDWHIVVLNSNCKQVPGGCGKDSPQGRWLRNELAGSSKECTLAYWHHPRFSSDKEHGNYWGVDPFWEILHGHGAEVVLSGHAHNYERFAPQDADGESDRDHGIRQFIVGTGGKSHYDIGRPHPNSQVRNDSAFGVLKLTLHDDSYDWKFIPVAGRTFTDSGTGSCHGRPDADG